jgi:hypothetical protein
MDTWTDSAASTISVMMWKGASGLA